MKREFINYEQALALKELGFNEPCLAYWMNETPVNPEGQCIIYYKKPYDDQNIINGIIKDYYYAPLYQQAFRFFREKFTLYHNINMFGDWDNPQFSYIVSGRTMNNPAHMWHFENKNSYEEAESACLDKLIEIVKSK